MGGESDFQNRKALVTGGSRGIGRAVCIELARRGADVAFLYRSRDGEAEATAAEIRALSRDALALKADIADAPAVAAVVDRAAKELGRVDVLVQAAGAVGAWNETAELSIGEWDRYIAVDLSGAFYAFHATIFTCAAPAVVQSWLFLPSPRKCASRATCKALRQRLGSKRWCGWWRARRQSTASAPTRWQSA